MANSRLITTGAFDLVSISGVDRSRRLALLHRVAGQRHAALSLSLAPRRHRPARADHAVGRSRARTLTPFHPIAIGLFIRTRNSTGPGVSDLISLPDHKVVRVFQDNAELKTKVAAILTNRTEMFQVDVGDGVKLDGWLIRPTEFDPTKKYPLIVNVYGEPAGPTVNDSWAGNSRLLLAALADDGYLIASFDNRGTPSPKGRAWRKVVYGSVGVLVFEGTGRGGSRARGVASVCRPRSCRSVWLERRRFDDAEPDVPFAGPLQGRRRRRAGSRRDVV